MRKRFAVLAALAFTAACNAVADGSYKGQPLVTLHGNIGLASGAALPTNPSVALIWYTQQDGGQVSTAQGLEGAPAFVGAFEPITATSFPASFDFQIFDPPPPEAMVIADGGLAAALIAAVDDVDGDGTFSLTTQVVPYVCSGDAGCVAPTGNWVAVLGASETLDSTGAIAQGSLVVISVTPPDVLMGASPDFYLFYSAGGAAVASEETGELNGWELGDAGYHLVNGCQLACGAQCFDTQTAIVPDSTPVDIDPDESIGLSFTDPSTLPLCEAADAGDLCATTVCPQGCNAVEFPGSSEPCACQPQSDDISFQMGAACSSQADCCTGLCVTGDGGQGYCGPATLGDPWCESNGCTASLANSGALVDLQQVAAPLPLLPQTHAAPPPGTYVLTAAELFTGFGGQTGPTGDTYQETISIGATSDAGIQFQQVSNDNACVNSVTGWLDPTYWSVTFAGCQTEGDFITGGGVYGGDAGTPTLQLSPFPSLILVYSLQQ